MLKKQYITHEVATLYSSLLKEQRRTYESNFTLATKIIERLRKYRISGDAILNISPTEIIEYLLIDEQNEALRELDIKKELDTNELN